ncbi:formate/nitrite transporter family protein [Geomicrobium sp. JCM 19039]|uniref:formate/nitrite transporter family protein n=1 Tax=Geomicrobium sp. JCM 19039 TaxID=1460636 RepID=UPI00045F29B0|nr:formate/nitrite transporter family protein [Geomicrobium sp. JCM 19039]GAK13009.1 formate/nitrite family of transporters [Geomicrobium sp. JCM 19039]
MYKDTIHTLNDQAKGKYQLYTDSPLRYLIASMLAGAYVGIGTIVLFSVGGPLQAAGSPFLDILTGATFGIALALVLWAGSELFTGNNLIFTVSSLSKVTTWKQTSIIWLWSYLGNFIGAAFFTVLIVMTGIFQDVPEHHYMFSLSAEKMNAPAIELLFRGILCNWIVCLAIWTSLRAEGDIAKLFLIFVLIFAFIAAGLEHSIANMSILGIALMHGGPDTVTWAGLVHNLIPVTIGNIIGGALFVGGLYFYISNKNQGEIKREA